jgi:RNA polymerase sigma-70 factor (ECF subfamily)
MDVAQVVAEHHRAVYAYAFRLSGSVPEAEDLTQQVFLVAQQKLEQLRTAESTRAWLFTILRNNYIRSCRKRRPVPAASLRLDIDAIPAEPPRSGEIDCERLQQAINQLPEAFRIVLAMFYFEQSSYREIAQRLELPIGTVMSRLARAKGHLRAKLFEPQRTGTPEHVPSAAK